MKKVILLLICIVLVQLSHGQDTKKGQIGDTRWSFGISFDILDQFTPEIDGGQTFKAPMDYGIGVKSWLNINSSLAVEFGLGSTAIRWQNIKSPFKDKNLHLFNFEAGLVYKFNNGYIFKETAPVAPFLFVKGIGSYMDLLKPGTSGSNIGFGIPLGGGLNIRIGDNVALFTSVAYTFGITDDYDNNLKYSLGLMMDLGGEKVIEVVVEPEPEDEDEDGIIDANDECPSVPGLAEFNGCPDTDGDGIMDLEDECPTEAGPAEFKGCPDSDGDGFADVVDDCPNTPGLKEFNGCPDPDDDDDGVMNEDDECPGIPGVAALNGCPDADGDGVVDFDDRCPTEAGPASNKGCPEVHEEVIKTLEFAAQNIQFETGSAVLKTASFSILDQVVTILKEWQNYSVKVEGHTDNVGSEESNQLLSEKRAQSAAAYLISKGITEERVASAGFGESSPIESNDSAAGRAKNRRVEFNLFIP